MSSAPPPGDGEPPPHLDPSMDPRWQSVDLADLVTVFEASTEFEAESIRAVLADVGIPSLYPPTGSSIFGFPLRATGVSIPVKVLPQDLTSAREALSQARFVGKSVDWDDVDVGDMPPEVRDAVDKGRGVKPMWLVGAMAVTLALVYGMYRMLTALGSSRGGACIALCASMLVFTAGCGYKLQGRAVEGFGSIDVTEGSEGDAHGKGLSGVSIAVIRDSRSVGRETVATAVSGKDGTFTLSIDSFGAGWMEEEWMIRASRSGFQNVETLTSLPGSTGGKLLVVSLQRGKSAPFQDPSATKTLMEEARQYEPGVGSFSR